MFESDHMKVIFCKLTEKSIPDHSCCSAMKINQKVIVALNPIG